MSASIDLAGGQGPPLASPSYVSPIRALSPPLTCRRWGSPCLCTARRREGCPGTAGTESKVRRTALPTRSPPPGSAGSGQPPCGKGRGGGSKGGEVKASERLSSHHQGGARRQPPSTSLFPRSRRHSLGQAVLAQGCAALSCRLIQRGLAAEAGQTHLRGGGGVTRLGESRERKGMKGSLLSEHMQHKPPRPFLHPLLRIS